MPTPSIHIILRFFQIAIFLILFITGLSGQAIELGPFSSDSFCVAAPKPLPVDTINWDDERAACIAELRATAIEKATKAWRDSIAIIIAAHIKKQKCFKDSFAESFTVRHVSTEHHYTLYYYDQAGNLVQTISPEGVVPLDTTEFPQGIWSGASPPHDPRFITRYQYNTVGQVVTQFTPDAGQTDFLYDRVQRLRFSQNAEQQPESNFAYTKYDNQGRVIEVGELTADHIPTDAEIRDQSFPGPSDLRNDTIITLYDSGDIPHGVPSDNTRGRIVEVHNEFIKSFYDYDAHGNVRELTHIMPQLIDPKITLKYDYDLISGNVNRFRYEPGELDQLTQRYLYDADNRLQSAYSSDDGYVFEEDARYFYYLHGPLARVELGEDKIQGMDYIYTLQGWLKGMNMPGGDPRLDPGSDGYTGDYNLDRYFGIDSTVYWLGYNDHDYTPITSADILPNTINYLWSSVGDEILPVENPKGLFNGNIPLLLTDNGKGLQAMAYQYDALHRIKSSKSIKWEDEWGTRDEYAEPIIEYDANGNIDTLARHDPMNSDILKYHYYNDYPNRLEYVSGTSDLSNIITQSSGNYEYDPIGNLIVDHSEETEMTWDVYGKLRSVQKPGGGPILYFYDTQGNRIVKNLGYSEAYLDVHVRDASGNIIATYSTSSFHALTNVLSEFNLYGSSRLGSIRPGRLVDSSEHFDGDLLTQSTRGLKYYELSNHLGNVLNTVSDRKLGQDDVVDGVADYYVPKILSHTDYYPFGLEMPGRTSSSDSHRFGFNGKEKDPSISSLNHNDYDYGFRIYNPAIGRFLSVDPLTRSYPMLTPYQFASNRPVDGVDIDGQEYLNSNESVFEFKYGNALIKKQYIPTEISVSGISESGPYIATNRSYRHFSLETSIPSSNFKYSLDPSYGEDVSLTPFRDWKREMKPGRYIPNSTSQFNPVGVWNNTQIRGEALWDELSLANPPSRTVGVSRLFLVGVAYDLGEQVLKNYNDWNFVTRFQDQEKILGDVASAINSAMADPQFHDYISFSQRNSLDLSQIMNFVLQGDRNISPENLRSGILITKNISKNYHPLILGDYSPKGLDNYDNIKIPLYKLE